MLDLATEKPIRLREAARLAGQGRGGKPIHESTVLRWILSGVRGPGRVKVRLDAVRLGNHWCTSLEAMQRFAERLTPNLSDCPTPPRSPTARQRAANAAAKKLDSIGIR
jgi:hypothetical protein